MCEKWVKESVEVSERVQIDEYVVGIVGGE